MSRSYYLSNRNLIFSVFENRKALNNESLINKIYLESEPNTPKRTGDLRFYVKRNANSSYGEISWAMKYAAYQERGSNPDGSRPVRNYTTPGTGPWFARNAVNNVMQNRFAETWDEIANSIPGPRR